MAQSIDLVSNIRKILTRCKICQTPLVDLKIDADESYGIGSNLRKAIPRTIVGCKIHSLVVRSHGVGARASSRPTVIMSLSKK